LKEKVLQASIKRRVDILQDMKDILEEAKRSGWTDDLQHDYNSWAALSLYEKELQDKLK
jgi:hypothetical protein